MTLDPHESAKVDDFADENSNAEGADYDRRSSPSTLVNQ
jgi:hypothetical protein